MAAPTYDAIVIGGGHNGLTAAAYLGNYEDYLYKKELMAEAAEKPREEPEREIKTPAAPGARRRAKRKVNPYKIQALTGKIGEVESAIHSHEARIATLDQMLATEELYRDYPLFRTTLEEHDRLKEELARFLDQWEKLQSQLASLET